MDIIFIILIFIVALFAFIVWHERQSYKEYKAKVEAYLRSDYYTCTRLSFTEMQCDPGYNGEYKLFCKLRNCVSSNTRFLFNLQIPYKGGCAEVDVVMINSYGVFVFASKNLYGWIFGDQSEDLWYETFFDGSKNFFYNPVLKNQTHVNEIKNIIDNKPCHSAVVFGENATLGDIDATADVLSIDYLPYYMKTKCKYPILSDKDILKIYNKLNQYVKRGKKSKHQDIQDINIEIELYENRYVNI